MARYDYQTADPMYYGLLKTLAAKHKAYPTEAEALIWNFLRANQLGERYRPQHIVGNYIADFCCVRLKLIIEIDGLYHTLPDQLVSDEERTEWLTNQGYKVIRFTNEEIFSDLENVINKIKHEQYDRYRHYKQ